jgi:hypothetical protein
MGRQLFSGRILAAVVLAIVALWSTSVHATTVSGALFEYDASNAAAGHTNSSWKNTGSASGNDLAMTNTTLGPVASANTNLTNAYSLNAFATGVGGYPGGNLAVDRSTGATIETWVRRDVSAVNDFEILVETGGNNGYALLLTDTTFTVVSDPSASVRADLDLSLLDDSDFIQLTAVWESSTSPNDQLVLYAKGSAGGAVSTTAIAAGTFPNTTGTGSHTGVFNMSDTSSNINAVTGNKGHLGGNLSLLASETLEFFRGDMAVVRIYDSELTAAQVQQNFDAVVPEPSTFALAAFGLLGLVGGRRRRKR